MTGLCQVHCMASKCSFLNAKQQTKNKTKQPHSHIYLLLSGKIEIKSPKNIPVLRGRSVGSLLIKKPSLPLQYFTICVSDSVSILHIVTPRSKRKASNLKRP